jgi:hypothetical protein
VYYLNFYCFFNHVFFLNKITKSSDRIVFLSEIYSNYEFKFDMHYILYNFKIYIIFYFSL